MTPRSLPVGRHRVLADPQRPLPERVAALVPVDADDVAGGRLPIETLVVVDVLARTAR